MISEISPEQEMIFDYFGGNSKKIVRLVDILSELCPDETNVKKIYYTLQEMVSEREITRYIISKNTFRYGLSKNKLTAF